MGGISGTDASGDDASPVGTNDGGISGKDSPDSESAGGMSGERISGGAMGDGMETVGASGSVGGSAGGAWNVLWHTGQTAIDPGVNPVTGT